MRSKNRRRKSRDFLAHVYGTALSGPPSQLFQIGELRTLLQLGLKQLILSCV